MQLNRPHTARVVVFALACLAAISHSLGDETPPTAPGRGTRHQVTGLFSVERVKDLREVFASLPQLKLLNVDFENAEVTVEYDPAIAFPGANANEIVERFDNLVRNASNHTFGIKPVCTLPKEKLTVIEIPVVGLDCKACCLGAYEAVYKLPGVERATASFKDGRVTATIDAEKISPDQFEAALKQRGVQLRSEP